MKSRTLGILFVVLSLACGSMITGCSSDEVKEQVARERRAKELGDKNRQEMEEILKKKDEPRTYPAVGDPFPTVKDGPKVPPPQQPDPREQPGK